MDVVRGDIYSICSGSIFYVQSHPDPTREKLRIYSIFNGTIEFSQRLPDGVRLRGDINVLLFGDPSTAKLQEVSQVR